MSANLSVTGDAPRHPRTVVGVVLAFLGAIALTLGVTGSPAAGLTDTDNLPLHNSSAPVGTDCPDGVNDYLHFVITPNNGTYSFVSINMELGASFVTFSGAAIISNGGQADNVFVAVPDGLTFDDVLAANWDADVAPAGYGDPKFVLSHLCDGTGTTTTLPCESNPSLEPDDPECVPTTLPCEWNPELEPSDPECVEPTTTTLPCEWNPELEPSDPECVEPTTTTLPCEWNPELEPSDPECVEPTTTTTTTTTTGESGTPTTISKTSDTTLPCEWDPELQPDDPNCTTSTVAIAPPTTVATGSNSPTTVAAQLPRTGPGATNTMLALGALLLLVGGVMVLSTRREHGVV